MNFNNKLKLFSKPFDAAEYKESKKMGYANKKLFSVKDREEIRKKLAMDIDSDDPASSRLLNLRKSNICSRIQNGMNIQICFMNDVSTGNKITELDNKVNAFDFSPNNNSFDDILSSNEYLSNETEQNETEFLSDQTAVLSESHNSFGKLLSSLSLIPKPKKREEFSAYHSNLFAEARAVLFHAQKWSKLKTQSEQMNKKRSCLAELLDLPFKGEWKKQHLFNLGITQLQLIVNDFHSQIETLNDALVKLLLDRDELHMEQDSILVDIEDLTVFLYSKGRYQ